jgi:hypothetical protein
MLITPSLRQQVIHDRERALLRFAGVGRAANQNEPLAEVHQDERWRAGAVALRICLKAREVNDRKLGLCGCVSFVLLMNIVRAKSECHASS